MTALWRSISIGFVSLSMTVALAIGILIVWSMILAFRYLI
jgi:hypothetical protein